MNAPPFGGSVQVVMRGRSFYSLFILYSHFRECQGISEKLAMRGRTNGRSDFRFLFYTPKQWEVHRYFQSFPLPLRLFSWTFEAVICNIPRMLRHRSCQDQGIGSRYRDQNGDMPQPHCHGESGFIGKGTERIDRRMDENAGDQTAAAVKNRDQQEAHRDGKYDLAQIADQIYAAAIEQIDNMSDAKGQAGNDDGRSLILLCDGCK